MHSCTAREGSDELLTCLVLVCVGGALALGAAGLGPGRSWRILLASALLCWQGTLAALQTLGESLVSALLAGVHPGQALAANCEATKPSEDEASLQAARSVDALPMVASWAAPCLGNEALRSLKA